MKSSLTRALALLPLAALVGACSDTTGPVTPSDAAVDTPVIDSPVTPDAPVVDAPVTPDAPVVDRPAPTDGGTPTSSAMVLSFGGDAQRTAAYRAETQLTPAALRSGRFGVDTGFAPSFDNALYGQPLYMSGLTIGGARHDVLFVATQGNTVYAVDALTGAELWHTSLGATVSRSSLSCGNISTIGVTSTPVIDPATRTLYVVSFTNEGALRFKINALDVLTGTQRTGYPAPIVPPMTNGSSLDERVTGQRGAIGFRDGRVYVPFGGLYGDCGIYHGWVVSIDATTPTMQTAFATPGRGSGIWAPGGFSMDSSGRIFAATGNSTPLGSSTPGSLGEYVLRITTGASGPAFAMGSAADGFSPSDARNLDLQDLDIGSVSPVLLPSQTPRLVQAGKAGTVYLLDPANLGGSTALSSTRVCAGGVFGAMAAWSNGSDTYAFVPVRGTRAGCSGSNGVVTLRLGADGTTFTTAWCSASVAASNPPAVSSNGNNDGVLWVTGASTGLGNTPVLRAYEVSTGMEVYANNEPPPAGVRQWVPPVVADGRVYITGANSVSMYRLR